MQYPELCHAQKHANILERSSLDIDLIKFIEKLKFLLIFIELIGVKPPSISNETIFILLGL